jgi:hypothetical protein
MGTPTLPAVLARPVGPRSMLLILFIERQKARPIGPRSRATPLWRFSVQGLVVETADPSGSRAFFHGQDGKARKISYPIQAGEEASRKVVVQCWGGKRPCFRNEGFGYQILASEDVWGVAIEPFFLFTGPDTRKPLPYAVQITHSKHWNTKTGMNHLTFWVDFLTKGEAFIDLRDERVHNLFLGRSLLRIPRLTPPVL